MKVEVVNLDEIYSYDNQRGCLSTDRVLKTCYRCDKYKDCESKVTSREYDVLIEELELRTGMVDILRERIKNL